MDIWDLVSGGGGGNTTQQYDPMGNPIYGTGSTTVGGQTYAPVANTAPATSTFDFSKGITDSAGTQWNFNQTNQPYNYGSDFWNSLGYTGNAWMDQSNADLVSGSGTDAGRMDPALEQWIKDKGYTLGSGLAPNSNTVWDQYFDSTGNAVGTAAARGAGNLTGSSLAKGALFAVGGNALGALAGGTGGMFGAGAAGAEAAGGLDAIAGADIAGGLVPEYGTIPAYNAGIGAAAGAGLPAANAAYVPGDTFMGPPMAGETAALPTPNNPSAYVAGGPAAPVGNVPTTDPIPTGVPSVGTPSVLGGGVTLPNGSTIPQSLIDILKGVGQGITSPESLAALFGIGNANKQEDMWAKQFSDLEKMYSPDSDYAKQMESNLARKDAAAGRNSQY